MNQLSDLHAAGEGPDEAPSLDGLVSPTVFVRTISTPAGAPWDQARAAALEARVGAPLPLNDVVYQLKRLDGWTFGRPARYAACYVRSNEVGDDFETLTEIDGRSVSVRFLSQAEQARRTRQVSMIGAGVAVTLLLVVGAGLSALAMRSDLDSRLSALEQTTTVRLRRAEAQQQEREQSRALVAAHTEGHTVNDVLGDLQWVSANKVSGAHIDSIHWESGFLGVEARGDGAPVASSERSVIKVNKPVRPDVWLWGISPMNGARTTSGSGPGL